RVVSLVLTQGETISPAVSQRVGYWHGNALTIDILPRNGCAHGDVTGTGGQHQLAVVSDGHAFYTVKRNANVVRICTRFQLKALLELIVRQPQFRAYTLPGLADDNAAGSRRAARAITVDHGNLCDVF